MLRNKNPLFPNFLDFKNSSFKPLHNAMDNLFKDLWREGTWLQPKRAEVLTDQQDEDLLRNTNTIGLSGTTNCGRLKNKQ